MPYFEVLVETVAVVASKMDSLSFSPRNNLRNALQMGQKNNWLHSSSAPVRLKITFFNPREMEGRNFPRKSLWLPPGL